MTNSQPQQSTGFIGLGAMGMSMAGHLVVAGFPLQVWNRSPGRVEQFLHSHKAVAATDLASLAAACEVIFTCVSADQDLLDVIAALRPALRPGTILCDHSTTSPQTAEQLATELAGQGCVFLDAPVSGGVEGAQNGKLVAMVGGDVASLARISPQLETYTRKVSRLGPAGSGQATKAVNQVMVAGIAEAVCEALALAEKLELPARPLLELLSGGAAGSWFLDHRGESMLEDRFDKGFKLALLYKDLQICEQLADELNLRLQTLRQARLDYQRLLESGEGDYDISALIHLKLGKLGPCE